MSGGGGGCGHGHAVGARINPGYYRAASDSIAAEMRERGLSPSSGEPDMEEKKTCNCAWHVIFAVLVCTIIFGIIWELT
jgi:hypothetical protein